MGSKNFPRVYYYDQDFVDLYDKSLAWLNSKFGGLSSKDIGEGAPKDGSLGFLDRLEYIDQFYTCMAGFSLSYSGDDKEITRILDKFYSYQESNGAIRARYNLEGIPIEVGGSENISFPLFSWVEYFIFNRLGSRKRVSEVVSTLDKYYKWLDKVFYKENGLYSIDVNDMFYKNSPRVGTVYPVDFNAIQACNAYYMIKLAEISNSKRIAFEYKKKFFLLKSRINSLMWCDDDGFYYDLDESENFIRTEAISGFFPMIVGIPNGDRVDRLLVHLFDEKRFNSFNPIPTLSMLSPMFDGVNSGYYGSVYSYMNFFVIKGLEFCERVKEARELSIRHMYCVLDSMDIAKVHPRNGMWESYKANEAGSSFIDLANQSIIRHDVIAYLSLFSVNLMIENIVGLTVDFARRSICWNILSLEVMGIEGLNLKNNCVTVILHKERKGWQIKIESEKLCYFNFNILNNKTHVLPIPSGKCSMLLDKLL